MSVLVVRAPAEEGLLRCGRAVMTPQRPPSCGARAEAGTIRPGDWFTDPVSGLEVSCTRAGYGTLTFVGRPLRRRPQPARLAAVRAASAAP